jgi:hypothetical protein
MEQRSSPIAQEYRNRTTKFIALASQQLGSIR